MLHYNQHISSSTMRIFRRTNCIITASGIVTLCKRPYSMPVESAVIIQFVLLRMSKVLLETCWGMLYAFFWVIPRRLNFICRRFGTLYLFHLHRQVGACRNTHLPAYKIQTPGNHPNESIRHSEKGESLKSRMLRIIM